MESLAGTLILMLVLSGFYVWVGYVVVWILEGSFPDRRARMAKILARKAKKQTNLLKDIKHGTSKLKPSTATIANTDVNNN